MPPLKSGKSRRASGPNTVEGAGNSGPHALPQATIAPSGRHTTAEKLSMPGPPKYEAADNRSLGPLADPAGKGAADPAQSGTTHPSATAPYTHLTLVLMLMVFLFGKLPFLSLFLTSILVPSPARRPTVL
jgi:hypothetical protein